MIAHRLSTLSDFDKIAVFNEGNLVEFGRPDELLEDRFGYFTRLSNGET
jgi:ABC-type multidrug transport system fused ATPase/permease subunit